MKHKKKIVLTMLILAFVALACWLGMNRHIVIANKSGQTIDMIVITIDDQVFERSKIDDDQEISLSFNSFLVSEIRLEIPLPENGRSTATIEPSFFSTISAKIETSGSIEFDNPGLENSSVLIGGLR